MKIYFNHATVLVIGTTSIPKDMANADYAQALADVDAGRASIEPAPAAPAPTAWRVPKVLIVERLGAAGKLTEARLALDTESLLLRERWNAADTIAHDDPDAIALLQRIGADPAVILALP